MVGMGNVSEGLVLRIVKASGARATIRPQSQNGNAGQVGEF